MKRGGQEKQKREKIIPLGDSHVSTNIRHRASTMFPRNLEGRAQNTWKEGERCIWKDAEKNLKGYTGNPDGIHWLSTLTLTHGSHK